MTGIYKIKKALVSVKGRQLCQTDARHSPAIEGDIAI